MPNKKLVSAREYGEVMGRLGLVRSLLIVCHRALGTNELANGPGYECAVLEEAIGKLTEVYDEFDLIGMGFPRDSAEAGDVDASRQDGPSLPLPRSGA